MGDLTTASTATSGAQGLLEEEPATTVSDEREPRYSDPLAGAFDSDNDGEDDALQPASTQTPQKVDREAIKRQFRDLPEDVLNDLLADEELPLRKRVSAEASRSIQAAQQQAQEAQQRAQMAEQQRERDRLIAAAADPNADGHWDAVEALANEQVSVANRQRAMDDPELQVHAVRTAVVQMVEQSKAHPSLQGIDTKVFDEARTNAESVADYYDRLYQAKFAGYLSPADAKKREKAVREDERTRGYGGWTDPDLTSSDGGGKTRGPISKDPMVLISQGIEENAARRRAS